MHVIDKIFVESTSNRRRSPNGAMEHFWSSIDKKKEEEILLEDYRYPIAIFWLFGSQIGTKYVCSDFYRCVPFRDQKRRFPVISAVNANATYLYRLHMCRA